MKKIEKEPEYQADEKTMVKVYGPYDGKYGRSLFVKTDTHKAYINANNSLNDLNAYELKEIEGDEEELGTLAEDITKLKWKPLEDNRSKTGSVSMIETNTILKDILGAIESMGKNITSLALIARRAEKKEEKPKKKSD